MARLSALGAPVAIRLPGARAALKNDAGRTLGVRKNYCGRFMAVS